MGNEIPRRNYFFPHRPSCQLSCSYCTALGCRSQDKTTVDIERSFLKAQSAEYSAVLLPCNAIYQSDLSSLMAQVNKHGLRVILQINAHSLDQERLDQLKDLQNSIWHLNLIWDSRAKISASSFDVLKNWKNKQSLSVTVVYEGAKEFKSSMDLLPEAFKAVVRVYAPFFDQKGEEIDSAELPKLLEKVDHFSPPLQDVFEVRAQDKEFEPMGEKLILSETETSNIKASIVVPFYNAAHSLMAVLKGLEVQTLASEEFEIVLVNDGSDDLSTDRVDRWMMSAPKSLNVVLVHWPRSSRRMMSDDQFRAGRARNLGVKYSRGEILLFLDADILLPPNYLEMLLGWHEDWDLIQPRRYQLKPQANADRILWSEVNFEKDTYTPRGAYWERFQECTIWDKEEASWRYVSSFALSIKKQLFKELGWFRKTYIFYGLEDTDLGFQAWLKGVEKFLAPTRVYHIQPPRERSEYSQSQALKQWILRRSVKIFYHNYLHPEIAHVFAKYLENKWWRPERILNFYFSSVLRYSQWTGNIKKRLWSKRP